jgi:hypothetical protein
VHPIDPFLFDGPLFQTTFNIDVKAWTRSDDAHPATRSDVLPLSCLDRAKNILAWLKTIPTVVCGCNRMASKSRMTFRCSSRPTNQLEAVVIGWFGDWEGTWVLNLLAPSPSPTDTMPRHDSTKLAAAFWHCAAVPAGF